MTTKSRASVAKLTVEEQLTLLLDLAQQVQEDQDPNSGRERLARWKGRAVDLLRKHVHPSEANKLAAKRLYGFSYNPIRDIMDEVMIYSGFLTALAEELEAYPDVVLDRPVPVPSVPKPKQIDGVPSSNAIFIIHGHDEVNLLRLKEVIRERWQLKPIVLSRQPGKGRTLIEKFEGEAMEACYAFALLTPDDIVTGRGSEYAQARPNVIFELGWFYGRLGREGVAILFKKGTSIHSDLDGIGRIEFQESIEEVIGEMERELTAVGLLAQNDARRSGGKP